MDALCKTISPPPPAGPYPLQERTPGPYAPPPPGTTKAGGTYPTGMLSCPIYVDVQQFIGNCDRFFSWHQTLFKYFSIT